MDIRREIVLRERILDIEFKVSRLGILGKEYYDLAQIKLKRHRTQISIAKTQNILLHAALSTLREKDRIARKNASDLENLRRQAVSLRVHFDRQRQQVFKWQRKLEWQITGTHAAELECAGVLDPNTNPELVIRSLEHKLGRARVKMQDVQMLVRHYEGTLQPLREEWIHYDAKLAALQSHVNIKNHECELLINTHHDAIRARDAAKIELEELLAFLFGYGKKEIVSPRLRSRILQAISEIKSVMDVESMGEMYHQFLVQEKQSSYLETMSDEMSRTLDLLRDRDYQPPRRKSSIRDREYAERMITSTTMIVQRQSEWRGSYPLLRILESTKSLVNRLHEGQITLMSSRTIEKEILEKCKLSIIQILQSLYRQMKKMKKEAMGRAESHETKEVAHWAKEEAEVARKKAAAEAARRKYEERNAAREAQREEEEARREEEEAQREAYEAQLEEEEAQLAEEEAQGEEYEAQGEEEEEEAQVEEEEAQGEEYEAQMDEEEAEGEENEPQVEEEEAQREEADMEAGMGEESQAQDEEPLDLPEEMTQQETEEATNLYDDQFARETEADEMVGESTVIFLPTHDREVGSRRVSSSDESEARISERSEGAAPSAVMSDDESSGASSVNRGRDGRVTPSTVPGTRPASGRFGRAATFTPAKPPAIGTKLKRAGTFTDPVRPHAVSTSRIAKSTDRGRVSPIDQDKVVTPPAILLPSEQLPTILALASETDVEEEPVISTEVAQPGEPKEGILVISEEKLFDSSELPPAAESISEEGASVDSALPGIKSSVVGTHGLQVSPTPESGMGSGAKTASPKPAQAGFPPVAVRVPTPPSREDHEKEAMQSGKGGPLRVAIPSSETEQSPLQATSRDVSGLPRSPSGAPIASGWGTGAKTPSPEPDEVLPPAPRGLGQRFLTLPRSPSGAPMATAAPFAADKAIEGDERVVQEVLTEEIASTSSRDALTIEGTSSTAPSESGPEIRPQLAQDVLPSSPEVPAAESLPSTPREMPSPAMASTSRGKGERSVSQSPRAAAEVRLARSPSGAPIASGWEGRKVFSPESGSLDGSLQQQPQTFGGLRSPIELPRSPSGAPVATAAKFPFGSHLSETSSPATSSGIGRSPLDTTRLHTTTTESESVLKEASVLAESAPEPEAQLEE